MPIDLNQPLRWKTANVQEQAMLLDLQANILKGHGRKSTANLFFGFASARAGREFLRALNVTSAREQLDDNERFKRLKIPGRTITLAFVSHAGYVRLRADPNHVPDDLAFRQGMAKRRKLLNDPLRKDWDAHLRQEVHALVLLADMTPAMVARARRALLAGLPQGVTLLGEETGLGMASRLSPSEGIEHFGYVDGRSQPLMLQEEIERERHERDGTSVWNPAFPLKTALVHDPAGKGGHSFGSYLVFRKLEQNVRGFKQAEEALAKALGLTGEQAERAGALIVGRFEDGTPVVMQKADGANEPVPNNFDFKDDPFGSKCPFHSHIRKSNPRGDSVALGATLQEERGHLMARRGITYGKRAKHPNSPSLTTAEMPTQGVGLLFMAYQHNIENQFEFTQASWVNNPDFIAKGTGIDPVIGQGKKGGQKCSMFWGGGQDAPSKAFDFRGFVTMKGGEYFFAPSISGLQRL